MIGHTAAIIYAMGAGIVATAILVRLSVVTHREKLGLNVPTPDIDPQDVLIYIAIVGLWPLIPIPLLGAFVHEYVIGPLVKRVNAAELMEKKLKSSK